MFTTASSHHPIIREHCEVGPTFSVSTSAFKQELNSHGVSKSASDIKKTMEKKSYRYKRSNGMFFCGLRLQQMVHA